MAALKAPPLLGSIGVGLLAGTILKTFTDFSFGDWQLWVLAVILAATGNIAIAPKADS